MKQRAAAPIWGNRPIVRRLAMNQSHGKYRRRTKPVSAPSPARQEEREGFPCLYARKCGGCQLQNMDYSRQLRWKQAQVQKLLGRYCRVNPIVGMEDPWHYRNKAQAAFAPGRGGIVCGLYQSSARRVLPVQDCPIQDPLANQIINTACRLAASMKIQPWDPIAGRGLLRHILVRQAFATGQILVALVTSHPAFPARKHLAEALAEAFPQITTIVHNVCPGPPMVLGEQETALLGPGYIEDVLCGCVFRISARSFYQINPSQAQTLYLRAIDLAGLTGSETAIDAYCGIGAIGILAASAGAADVVGVEINPDAVRDAVCCARMAGLKNIRFVRDDASRFMARMAEDGLSADVVFMDPPRQGSDRIFLSALARLAPQRVVYISCNPVTQARDVAFLARQGYRIRAIQPVDMFPHTNHIENIVLLRK